MLRIGDDALARALRSLLPYINYEFAHFVVNNVSYVIRVIKVSLYVSDKP
jgi:hypothetical protein